MIGFTLTVIVAAVFADVDKALNINAAIKPQVTADEYKPTLVRQTDIKIDRPVVQQNTLVNVPIHGDVIKGNVVTDRDMVRNIVSDRDMVRNIVSDRDMVRNVVSDRDMYSNIVSHCPSMYRSALDKYLKLIHLQGRVNFDEILISEQPMIRRMYGDSMNLRDVCLRSDMKSIVLASTPIVHRYVLDKYFKQCRDLQHDLRFGDYIETIQPLFRRIFGETFNLRDLFLRSGSLLTRDDLLRDYRVYDRDYRAYDRDYYYTRPMSSRYYGIPMLSRDDYRTYYMNQPYILQQRNQDIVQKVTKLHDDRTTLAQF